MTSFVSIAYYINFKGRALAIFEASNLPGFLGPGPTDGNAKGSGSIFQKILSEA